MATTHRQAKFTIGKLQEDNRALDRLTKSKEAALLEAERTVEVALAKASMVDDLQNKNQERQEENKILDKMHRQKVAEVEKLTQNVRELEEAVLDGGAAANAMLAKKVDTLTKAMEVEAKKMRREVAAMEKEVDAIRVEKEHENRSKRFASKGPPSASLQEHVF
ncbi:hypothetical protein QQ045_027730 [Rhodiola kirilowii]